MVGTSSHGLETSGRKLTDPAFHSTTDFSGCLDIYFKTVSQIWLGVYYLATSIEYKDCLAARYIAFVLRPFLGKC